MKKWIPDSAARGFGRRFTTLHYGFLAACSAALSATVISPATAQEVSISPGQRYQLALEAQAERNYTGMLTHLRQAANEGEAQAQATLAMTLLAGQTLYGDAIQIDRCEALYWARKAATDGNAFARGQLVFLSRARAAPSGLDVCAYAERG